MIASSGGKTDIVRLLIGAGARIDWTNENGQTSLHYAASRNRLEIAQILIDNGCDVNVHDNLGSTPLHRCASRGWTEMVKLLLSTSGIQVDPYDNFKNTPL